MQVKNTHDLSFGTENLMFMLETKMITMQNHLYITGIILNHKRKKKMKIACIQMNFLMNLDRKYFLILYDENYDYNGNRPYLILRSPLLYIF